ncbi:MAG: hypothetical protein A2X49_06515 [Lentisphaerae bacterium GWF2_52_8]|nr:MAG: hypothetical protein A2X49_06515 [Lentisphaerae bacterium GWF2_52_8]
MKVVKRALDLLLLLKHFEEMPLKRISMALGVKSNSAWNLLNYLCKEGYVEKSRAGCYKLGAEYQNFAGTESGTPREILERTLSKLSSGVKESCIVARLEKTQIEVLHWVNYEREIMVSNRIYDQKDALYCWASGHVLLAWQTELIVNGVISCNGFPKPKQWLGAQSWKGLLAELARIRAAGFAERNTQDLGLCSLAVPVICNGKATMALGINYLSFRNTIVHRQAILGNLKLAAETLSKRLENSIQA